MTEDPRFISSPPVEDVLAEFMTPLMAAAGFRQRRNRYQLAGDNGALVSVQVKPWASSNQDVTFGMNWFAFPPVLAEFLGRTKKLRWPPMGEALFVKTVVAPESVRSQPYARSQWECRFADYERFGEVFTSALRTELIPSWVAALDPAYLVASSVGVDCAFPYGYPPLRELFLTIDNGAKARLRELLNGASGKQLPDPDVLPWLQSRLEQRR